MKHSLLLLSIFLLPGCGSVAPIQQVNNWQTLNHKTKYSVKEQGVRTVYLTVKYSSYTFLDKSSDAIPVARQIFRQVALQEGARRGGRPVYEEKDFYDSTGYNGITGISETLVSNTVHFQ